MFKLNSVLRSLKHRNYRLFFTGQLVSLIGTWITNIATNWLIYRLTGSTVLLASLNAAGLIPSLIFSPIAGVHVDRWDRRKVLLFTQGFSMLQSFALAFLSMSGIITVPELFGLVIFQGLVNAVDLPARQSFVTEIVDSKEDLSNAIALNSALFNGARLIGPAIGGLLIAASSEGICFLVDGISYLAVLISLTRIRILKPAKRTKAGNAFQELIAGIVYAAKFEPIAAMILMVAAVSFAAAPYIVLLTPFTSEELHGGPDTLGLLMSASGIGALSGAIYLASRKSIRGMGKVMKISGRVLGVSIILLALCREVWMAVLVLPFIGTCMILLTACSNTIIQTIVEPTKRGRVMSLFGTAFNGMMPFGSLVAGTIAHYLGIRFGIAFGAVIILVATELFTKRLPHIKEKVRPVLIERAVITDVPH